MPLVVTISGSPTVDSRTARVTARVAEVLRGRGFDVQGIDVRDLPPADLLHARVESGPVAEAVGLVARARGVVVSTPIYKAAYSGILKAFLDLLPQRGLAGKVVLPLATGGTLAHVLALDYALRPVLSSMGAPHIVAGLFLLERLISFAPDGALLLDPEIAARLDDTVADFAATIERG